MYSDIEICGGHYVYDYEDGELQVYDLSGEPAPQDVYEAVEDVVNDGDYNEYAHSDR